MRVLVTILGGFILIASCRGISTVNTITGSIQQADTIVLRQICSYCNSEVYKQESATKLCFCTDILEPYTFTDSSKLMQFVSVVFKAKHLTIENPSTSINKIPFKDFESLETLYIFGNDYNTDGLKRFPKELLELKKLKQIEFEGVRFDRSELQRIKKEYLHIKIIGEIDDY